MKLNKTQIADIIERVAGVKARIANDEAAIAGDILLLKKLGGGESDNYVAELIKMPAKTMTVKAHKQLRITAK